MDVEVTTYYLEMQDPDELTGKSAIPEGLEVRKIGIPSPEFNRFLYVTVGKEWLWIDRLVWSAEKMETVGRSQRACDLGRLHEGAPAGYFELVMQKDRSVEIAFFGLLPQFIGKGLGGYLLSEAIRKAWALDASRVWVHTCTLDHPPRPRKLRGSRIDDRSRRNACPGHFRRLMRIVTWNVNSIRRRLDGVLTWLERARPDVVCLQETKCTDDVFPWIGFKSMGYEVSFTGQRSYNGVAIASRCPLGDVDYHPLGPRDSEKRSIAATIDGVRILNVYVPYGEKVGTEKFRTKLRWLDRLNGMLKETDDRRLVVSGDFNVAPDDRDVYDPGLRREKLICSTPERDHFNALLQTGFIDAVPSLHRRSRTLHLVELPSRRRRTQPRPEDRPPPGPPLPSNPASSPVDIDRAERKNPDASDHTPVTLILDG